VAEKTLRSAISNFQMNPDNARFDVDDLYVRECSADGGPVLKRISPAPMGRAYRIRKRSNHLTIIVGDSPTPRIAAKPTRGSKKKDVARTTPSTKQVSADNKQ